MASGRRELDEVLRLTGRPEDLADEPRTGRNIQHDLVALLRYIGLSKGRLENCTSEVTAWHRRE